MCVQCAYVSIKVLDNCSRGLLEHVIETVERDRVEYTRRTLELFQPLGREDASLGDPREP